MNRILRIVMVALVFGFFGLLFAMAYMRGHGTAETSPELFRQLWRGFAAVVIITAVITPFAVWRFFIEMTDENTGRRVRDWLRKVVSPSRWIN